MGEPLAKFWLFTSVSGTDTTPTKEIKYKKELSVGTPCKIMVVILNCVAFVGLPNEAKSDRKKRARWGNLLKNSGCFLQLLELIPSQPKKLNIKKISVVEPLAKLRLLSSVALPLLDFLMRPRADNLIRLV